MSKYLEVCERVALAADGFDKAKVAWETHQGENWAVLGEAAWRAEADKLTEKLWKARANLKTALGEFRAYLA